MGGLLQESGLKVGISFRIFVQAKSYVEIYQLFTCYEILFATYWTIAIH
jgi:hypothetical protein